MFTGIVEETGAVLALDRSGEGARLTVKASVVTQDLRAGDSIAVNGCCLTATDLESGTLAFDLLNETLERTNLKDLATGALVNLERALAANARLGGHFVQGHIDCTSPVIAFEKSGADYRLEIALPKEFAQYVVSKGSIAINGVSLTVAELKAESFVIWLIPHTLEITNLRALQAGSSVNLEFDMLAKYVERILAK
jgi:riboflavin synthase